MQIKVLCAGLCGCLLAVGHTSLAGERKLTIKDNLGRPWVSEPIAWEMPGVKANKVLVKRDGRPIPAQVVAAPGGLRVLLIIDRLAKDASTTLTADLDEQGPTETDLSVATDAGGLVLANKYAAVRLNNEGAGDISPILGIRTASGKW
ncbi:MAG: hypothetical protein ABSG53_24005, partial [Thermoguttaceae bacterium]